MHTYSVLGNNNLNVMGRIMGRSRYKITEPQQAHFLTMTINHWLPVFTRPDTVNIVLDCWKYLQENTNMKLYAYVILENHLHFIAESKDLNKQVQQFKSYTARQIIDYLKGNQVKHLLKQMVYHKKAHKTQSIYQVWEEGTHPQLIQNVDMLRQKIDYIHHNPVKRGYVEKAEHWCYSSARNYQGKAGLIEIYKEWDS